MGPPLKCFSSSALIDDEAPTFWPHPVINVDVAMLDTHASAIKNREIFMFVIFIISAVSHRDNVKPQER